MLRRYLATADLAAAAVVGGFVTIFAGLSAPASLAFIGLSAACWLVIAFAIGLYAREDLRSWASGVAEMPRLAVAGLLVSWLIFGVAAAFGSPAAVPVALASAVLLAITSGLARSMARVIVHRAQPLRQRTIIVGSGYVAGQLVDKLTTQSQFGLDPIGIVDDDYHPFGSPELPTLGRLDDLSSLLKEHQVDRVIIAFSRATHQELLQVIRACRDSHVAIDIVPRLFEFLEGARSLDQVGGMPLLSIGAPTLSRSSRIGKRVLDVSIASTALLVLLPFGLITALLIKLESRGPVFFRQVRSGRSGEVFRLIKFRSMFADAEDRKDAYQTQNESNDGVMFKIREDPRVTGIGRFLRRTSLDELPQLINVVRGEMSLVGPRPLILPETAALAEAWHQRRLDLRPGITGPWQVSGRSDIPFQEMVRFDYQYVAGWSLARDIEILFETVPAVLSGRGAY